MEYRQLGNTGLKIPALGFGAMRLPIARGSGDFNEAIPLIQHAIKKGISFFDVGTFYCGHQCEAAFGQAIHGIGQSLIMSGKNSSHQSGQIEWNKQLQNTLRLFNCNKLDFYFLHYLDYEVWNDHYIRKGIINQVENAKSRGLFSHLGFSSHDTPENIKKLIDTRMFDAVILSYNMLHRRYEETIQYAKERGLGVIIMNPLAGGLITNGGLELTALTGHFGAGIISLALNYVLSNPHVDCVLSGMQTISQIDQNVSTTQNARFTPEDIVFINQMTDKARNREMIYCTGCGYCLPCPQGIYIPEIIRIWNQYNMVKGKRIFQRDYQVLENPADCCIECYICEERCPNGIGVAEIMVRMAEMFA